MRSLIVVTILCLAATPAFACVYDNECKNGSTCLDGLCRERCECRCGGSKQDVAFLEHGGRGLEVTHHRGDMPRWTGGSVNFLAIGQT